MSGERRWRILVALTVASLVAAACGSNRQDEILARSAAELSAPEGSAAGNPLVGSGDALSDGGGDDAAGGAESTISNSSEDTLTQGQASAGSAATGTPAVGAGATGAQAVGGQGKGIPATGTPAKGTPAPGGGQAARNSDPEVGVLESKVRIGFVCTLSGPFVELQKRVCQIAQAQVRQANERAGIHGRKIEFIVVDDQFTNAGMGSANIRRLVEQDKVFAIIAIAPFTCSVIGDYIDSKQVPLFCDGVFETEYGHDWIWFPQPKTIVLAAHVAAQWIVPELGPRVAVVTHPTAQWAAGAAQLTKTVQAKGGQVVRRVDVAEDEGDYTAAVVNVRSTNPDAVYLNLMPDGVLKWYLAAQRLDYRPAVVTGATGDAALIPEGIGDFVFPYRTATTFAPPVRGTPAGDAYFKPYETYFPGTDWRPASVNDRTTHCLFRGFMQALDQTGPELTRARFLAALKSGSYDCGLSPAYQGWAPNASPYAQGLMVEWTRDSDGAITPKSRTDWIPGP